jgi:hypothetical protein
MRQDLNPSPVELRLSKEEILGQDRTMYQYRMYHLLDVRVSRGGKYQVYSCMEYDTTLFEKNGTII